MPRYHAAAAKLAAQFDGYCPLSDLCVNGKQVLSENIADLAGLLVAHDAYVLSLKGKTDVVIGGLTGEQRFFLAFAQRWRKTQSEAALRRQITTDTHAPGEYRSDTVRNVDAWYKALRGRARRQAISEARRSRSDLVTPITRFDKTALGPVKFPILSSFPRLAKPRKSATCVSHAAS